MSDQTDQTDQTEEQEQEQEQEEKKDEPYYTLITRENMGSDARKTSSKVSIPYIVKVESDVESNFGTYPMVPIRFDNIKTANEWIRKNGNVKNIYYIVKSDNLDVAYEKWTYFSGISSPGRYTQKWQTTTFMHPNEKIRLINNKKSR